MWGYRQGHSLALRPTKWSRRHWYVRASVVLAVVLLALIPVAVAQSSRRPPPGVQTAARALLEGRYDEVATLTSQLNQAEPAVAALIARALVARGRYEEAEATLRPVAQLQPTSEAALELGLLLQDLRRADAEAMLARVAVARVGRDAAGLTRVARALHALGRFREANGAYRDAAAAAPGDSAINTAWGLLFLEAHNNAEALNSFQEALADDPAYSPAMLGAARALAEDNPPQAIEIARKALEINPSDVGALVFLAGQAIDAGEREEGRAWLQKALAVNPSSLEALSLLAGLEYVEDDRSAFDAAVAKVLELSPSNGELFRVAGQVTARSYRFDEAVVLARRGLALEPRNPQVLADLGIHLLRTGDEPGAREVLESSFSIDPFNVVTFNLLQMMDTLDTFVTIEEGDIVLRMHEDEAPVLQRYALDLARRALASLSARYRFQVRGPILIEVFPKHDDFAVRIMGLPGMIGALGACFGRVVTMDSPRARPPGDFQWEATLWHELAHVVTLQMSNQRVPRWLTEGLSVYEETLARREWGRGMDVEFAQVLNRGESVKLRDLNAAFQSPQTISLAYFQAYLLAEHLVARFGDDGIQTLLRAYGQGLEGDAALEAALGTNFDELQTGFDEAVERRFGAMRAALEVPDRGEVLKMPLEILRPYASRYSDRYPVQFALGTALRQAGEPEAALQAFERAAELVPLAAGENSPNMQIAQIAIELEDRARAIVALEALMEADFNNLVAVRQLALLLGEDGVSDPTRLRPVYERIVAIDPFDAEAHARLGRLAMQRDDLAVAIREFQAVVSLRPVDLATAHTDLAESYFKSGQRAEARKEILAALEIAPSFERAQELLLEISETRR